MDGHLISWAVAAAALDSYAMWASSEVALVVSSVLLLLLGSVLARERATDASVRAGLALIAVVILHLLAPVLRAHGAPPALVQAAAFVEGAVPLAFWWLARAHFDDDFRFRPLHAAVLAGFLLLGSLPAVVPAARYPLWPLLPRLAALVVVAQALVRVHVGGQSDLVMARLQARPLAVALTGGYIFVELLAELLLGRAVAAHTAEVIHAGSSAVLVFVVCAVSLRPQPSVVPSAKPAAEPPPLDPALADRLQHLLEGERVFLQEGLTIAVLAERLAVHEYKVRQLINSRLGFKNFNSFLHHYRIREAQRLLSDPALAHRGIAQVAYDVGYSSLGPFNKAFKDLVGRTPTEFRASASASPPPATGVPAVKPS
jgi:AraC-like DNA-binding protein